MPAVAEGVCAGLKLQKQGRHAAGPHLMRSACCATICRSGASVAARPGDLAGVVKVGEERHGGRADAGETQGSEQRAARRAALQPTRLRRRPPAPPAAPPWCAAFLTPALATYAGRCELSEARNNLIGAEIAGRRR